LFSVIQGALCKFFAALFVQCDRRLRVERGLRNGMQAQQRGPTALRMGAAARSGGRPDVPQPAPCQRLRGRDWGPQAHGPADPRPEPRVPDAVAAALEESVERGYHPANVRGGHSVRVSAKAEGPRPGREWPEGRACGRGGARRAAEDPAPVRGGPPALAVQLPRGQAPGAGAERGSVRGSGQASHAEAHGAVPEGGGDGGCGGRRRRGGGPPHRRGPGPGPRPPGAPAPARRHGGRGPRGAEGRSRRRWLSVHRLRRVRHQGALPHVRHGPRAQPRGARLLRLPQPPPRRPGLQSQAAHAEGAQPPLRDLLVILSSAKRLYIIYMTYELKFLHTPVIPTLVFCLPVHADPMRFRRGMEVQVLLNDVVGIMDLENEPLGAVAQDLHLVPKAHNWSDPDSPVSSSSDDNGSELFSWNNELKLALSNVKNNLASSFYGGMPLSSGLSASNGRKRKMWNDDVADSPLAKVPTSSPQELNLSNEQQLMISEQLIIEDCDDKLISRFKNQATNRPRKAGSAAPNKMTSWQVEDIADNLEADLDGSLSGLDLNPAPYNMSEALLALPSLSLLKQEAPSPTSQNDASPTSGNGGVGEPDSNARNAKGNKSAGGSPLHQLLQQHNAPGTFSMTVLSGSPAQHPQLDSSSGPAVVGNAPSLNHGDGFQHRNLSAVSSGTSSNASVQQDLGIDCRFQYVLAAATSIATKVNEETLTYLNQGQSYEIKLKKLGELSAYRGKILKSVIRICFHERRLQYMEREQMAAWQASRPGDRIVEVDIPLSYGVYDVFQDQCLINTVEFSWDPTKEVGVYIKVNCISTEFTPNKHGGEKGVPFRIQVETYLQDEGTLKRLHAAACQIKVFKLKGADRKHKQDREKILKRPPLEQEKFQPSYDCTVLNDIPTDSLTAPPLTSAVTSTSPSAATYSPQQSNVHVAAMLVLVNTVTLLAHDDLVVSARFYHAMAPVPPSEQQQQHRIKLALLARRVSVTWRLRRRRPQTTTPPPGVPRLVYYHKRPLRHSHSRRSRNRGRWEAVLITNTPARGGRNTPTTNSPVTPVAIVTAKEERNNQPLASLPSPAASVLPDSQPLPSDLPLYLQPLPSEATALQTAQWLQSNRFGSYLRVFASFSGADILRLSRDDLIQICGLPDGIRLFNALHSKAIAPRLTLYLCVEQNAVYHALYLDNLSCGEMASKLAQLMGISPDQIHDIYIQGPGGIHVLITDDVVRNIKDEAMFAIEILQDHSGERYRLLLKPAQR
ncbi:hypothetical protein C0J52_10445, partial [Blattella germanica]